MTTEQRYAIVRRRFVLAIVGLAALSVFGLGFALYETSSIRLGQNVSPRQLHSLVEEGSALESYLQEQKDYEAHFVTIANLVRADQQANLGRVLVAVTIPTMILVSVIAYIVARRLLRPIREAHESQERFIQDAAHELRNPLAAMMASLQNAKRSRALQPAHDLVRTLERQTKRLARITEDLLFLERGVQDQQPAMIDVSELLQDVLEDLQPHVAKRNIQLTTAITESLQAPMQPLDLVRLIKNVVENALKYTPNGKTVHVELMRDGRDVVLTVRDEGIGIPTKDLESIGQRFFRAGNVGSIDGTGLGLAIVYKLVHRYSGRIDIESEEGTGTTVSVRLPLYTRFTRR